MSLQIRHAVDADLESLTDIYNYYVAETPFTFDLEPKSLEQRREWLSQFRPETPHQLIVATEGDVVIGYVGSGRFREKRAYDTSIETTIYLQPGATRKGTGTLLYNALFAAVAKFDIHRAYAGITQPNAASVRLHEKVGFVPIGTYREVGRKFGQYWDVQWFEKNLDS